MKFVLCTCTARETTLSITYHRIGFLSHYLTHCIMELLFPEQHSRNFLDHLSKIAPLQQQKVHKVDLYVQTYTSLLCLDCLNIDTVYILFCKKWTMHVRNTNGPSIQNRTKSINCILLSYIPLTLYTLYFVSQRP